jgi:ethanolamine ammonia-lyase small subunit
MDVDPALLEKLGLFSVQTLCTDKNQFLTRPDLGRRFSDETLRELQSKCQKNVDVQIYASDGLSSTAIKANLENILPAIMDGLKSKGLSVGTPFYVRFGRVGTEDAISEALGCKVVCVLIGERPGLATAESMSAYIAYNATVGMPEARRTVVSNIHSGGIAAVEAGAYIADMIEKIYKAKKSGVELQNG